MDETLTPEGLGGVEEQPGKPIPEVSEASAEVQPSSQPVDMDALAAKLADKLLPRFEEQAQRRAQSIFDKTSYQFGTMAKYLQEAGGDPKKAAREMALDNLVERELGGQSSEPEVRGRTKGEDDETLTAKFLNELKDESGVEFSDEELHKIWDGKRYTNWDDAKSDARKAAWKKSKQGNIGAAAAASVPGEAAASVTQADLAKELKDIQAGKYGSAFSPENKDRRAEIKAKLAKGE